MLNLLLESAMKCVTADPGSFIGKIIPFALQTYEMILAWRSQKQVHKVLTGVELLCKVIPTLAPIIRLAVNIIEFVFGSLWNLVRTIKHGAQWEQVDDGQNGALAPT